MIGRVEVISIGGKFARHGIDLREVRFDTVCLALGANAFVRRADQFADGLIGEAELLDIA